jgi:hypothetical protein
MNRVKELRFVLVTFVLLAASAFQTSAAEVQDRNALIDDCKSEAVRGHLQGLLVERRGHYARMTAICKEWRIVRASGRDDLSRRCLVEARRGPSIGPRQRSTNQSHIFRLRELCRKLASI